MPACKTAAEKAATRRARNQRYNQRRKDETGSAAPKKARGPLKIAEDAIAMMGGARQQTATAADVFRPDSAYPPGVVPSGSKASLAMDDAFSPVTNWAAGALGASLSILTGYDGFPGYPALAMLTLRPEHRKVVEVFATEATRRWIKIQSTDGDEAGEDKSDKIKALTDAMDRMQVRDLFRKASEVDGYFGRAHIYPDFGEQTDQELTVSIGNGRDAASKAKVKKGSLKGFKVVEPMWVYPTGYDASKPLSREWYKPREWAVQGKSIHATRMLTLVSREVPDILKPAFQFGGLALSWMIKAAVDNFVRTRQSISDLLHSFSTSGIKSDLSTILQGGAASELIKRAKLFNATRDNRGLLILDKETEDFFNVSTPLGTLDHLQAQSQEQIASIAGIPLVKLLGVTPSGLNASSDGEIRCFYDAVHAYQERFFSPVLDRVFAFVQLSEFGEVDPDLTYKYEPLWTLDEKELAEVQEIKARTAAAHIDAGVLSPQEERDRIADDPDAPYTLDDELPAVEPDGDSGNLEAGDEPRGLALAHDAEWREEEHPRGEGGKFGGSVHVVSSQDPDTDRTKVHGVFADEAKAAAAHADVVRGAYRRFHENNFDGPARRVPLRTALKRLVEHGRTVPTMQSIRVGGAGEDTPSHVSLVHEAQKHEEGHDYVEFHGSHVDHGEATDKAGRIAKGYWDAGHQSHPHEMPLGDARKMASSWNDRHPEYKTDSDLNLPPDAPSELRDKLEAEWMNYMNQPQAYPGLRKANRYQTDTENMGRGGSRSGVFNVTRHPVL